MMQRRYIDSGGILDFDPDFLPSDEADKLFDFLMKNVSWNQNYYTNFRTGEKYPQPRQTAWFADNLDMAYTYSGVTEKVQPWLPELLDLKSKIESVTKAEYNSVLLNLYRTGKDSVGMHADDEKELGTNANIASVSLGATRLFVLSNYASNPNWIPNPGLEYSYGDSQSSPGWFEYELNNGSLIVMSGTTQQHYKHEVPKQILTAGQIKRGIKPVGPRINLTFRKFFKA